MRALGEVLGFVSSRPEQEADTESTLDVLWLHEDSKSAILWSLKSKKEGTPLNGEEIGSGHNHLEWFRREYPDYKDAILVFIAPITSCVSTSHPSDEMKVVTLEDVQQFYRALDQAMIGIFRTPPAVRVREMEMLSKRPEWMPDGILRTMKACAVERLR